MLTAIPRLFRPGTGNRRMGPQVAHLIRGVGAYGSAELASRVVRLAMTVVIARQLAPNIVGEAALAITVFEFVRMLDRTGAGYEILRAEPADLPAICNTVRHFYIGWAAVLMVVQALTALGLAVLFGRPTAGWMVGALALVYPFMALGHVEFHLGMRNGEVGKLAQVTLVQSIADQFLTAGMLLAWASPWSIVLPKLLTAPLWMVMARRAASWRPDRSAGRVPLRRILHSAAAIMISDGLGTLRTQGDNLIVAAVLGTSALGTYFFAFNAGIGIITSLVNAYGSVALPMLCRAPDRQRRLALLQRVTAGGLALFLPLIALQALAAHWYVPIVFGQRWTFAAPLIATLCLAGLPILLTQLTACWLRAEGQVTTDAIGSALGCALALGGLWIGALHGGLLSGVVGLVAGQTLGALLTALRVLLPVLTGSDRAKAERFA